MKKRSLFIYTLGCQMNVYDSEQIEKVLIPSGYEKTNDINQAHLIIVNTCAIRAKAEQKLFSFLGRLASLKKKNPDLVIAVGGCVAQQEGKKILERSSLVDLVFGTHCINGLPQYIEKILFKRERMVYVDLTKKIDEYQFNETITDSNKTSRFVTIMRGCDNFCTYCVVPNVRGPEVSRRPDRIIEEIKDLVDSGVREVTLLGQNVNSYGKKQRLCSFPELLAKVNRINGLYRIRFVTSHPKDLSQELIDAFTDLDKLCPHIHLPVQSGSNRILKKMNRKYTKELYIKKVARLREKCPQIAITSDFIVGFPGETKADYYETLDLIKELKFDGLFSFKYSQRPNTPSAHFPDKISEKEKGKRLQKLLFIQNEIELKKNFELIGSMQQVLVEDYSKNNQCFKDQKNTNDVQYTGRTTTNRIVNFDVNLKKADCKQEDPVLGEILEVKIKKAFAHSLFGEPTYR